MALTDLQKRRIAAARELNLLVRARFHRERLGELDLTPADGRAAAELVIAVAKATMDGDWSGVLRARDALVEKDRGVEERYVRAAAACEWALWAWRRGRARGHGESRGAHKNRLEAQRPWERRIAEMLLRGIKDEAPKYDAKVHDVRAAIVATAKRSNGSPVTLLMRLAAFPSVSEASIKKAIRKKRQTGT